MVYGAKGGMSRSQVIGKRDGDWKVNICKIRAHNRLWDGMTGESRVVAPDIIEEIGAHTTRGTCLIDLMIDL